MPPQLLRWNQTPRFKRGKRAMLHEKILARDNISNSNRRVEAICHYNGTQDP